MENSVSPASSGSVASTLPAASTATQNNNSQQVNYGKLLKQFFDSHTSIDDAKFDKIRTQIVQQIQNNPKLLTDTPSRFIIIDGLTTIHFYNFEHRVQRESFESGMSLEFVTAYGTETFSRDKDTPENTPKDTPTGNKNPTAFSFVDLFNPDFCKKLFQFRGGHLNQQEKELIKHKRFNVKDERVPRIIMKLLNHPGRNPVEDDQDDSATNNNNDTMQYATFSAEAINQDAPPANNEQLAGIPVDSTISNSGNSGTVSQRHVMATVQIQNVDEPPTENGPPVVREPLNGEVVNVANGSIIGGSSQP